MFWFSLAEGTGCLRLKQSSVRCCPPPLFSLLLEWIACVVLTFHMLKTAEDKGAVQQNIYQQAAAVCDCIKPYL